MCQLSLNARIYVDVDHVDRASEFSAVWSHSSKFALTRSKRIKNLHSWDDGCAKREQKLFALRVLLIAMAVIRLLLSTM